MNVCSALIISKHVILLYSALRNWVCRKGKSKALICPLSFSEQIFFASPKPSRHNLLFPSSQQQTPPWGRLLRTACALIIKSPAQEKETAASHTRHVFWLLLALMCTFSLALALADNEKVQSILSAQRRSTHLTAVQRPSNPVCRYQSLIITDCRVCWRKDRRDMQCFN